MNTINIDFHGVAIETKQLSKKIFKFVRRGVQMFFRDNKNSRKDQRLVFELFQ